MKSPMNLAKVEGFQIANSEASSDSLTSLEISPARAFGGTT